MQYLTQNQRNTDAIISDSLPQHPGTPKVTFSDFYFEKYADGSEYRALLSMTYFGDADPQPMPYMFINATWESIKEKILQEEEGYTRQNS